MTTTMHLHDYNRRIPGDEPNRYYTLCGMGQYDAGDIIHSRHTGAPGADLCSECRTILERHVDLTPEAIEGESYVVALDPAIGSTTTTVVNVNIEVADLNAIKAVLDLVERREGPLS